ncbi:FtsX-like permease family protein [Cryptosporangium arvum]|uniref:ABC-type antimicrobial peptide transport system, permease component n=1 Tax=Cryptosporangium arvum DSM 44712 TaxID=927661 RepID=A0A011A0C6_9ACTN|nr:FtsX-like permease family protein [Cryptosporangium arvum]EXG82942.1 ABC-type antimicrobial peptide transport system, permease component [Cryptosporangium arvum DSM 44712]
MTALLTRRARAQWALLLSLLTVLTLGATLLGTCTLLTTRTSERAVEVAASRADPAEVRATAYTVTIAAADARSVAADARTVLTDAMAPFAATTTTRASGVMQRIPAASDESRGLLSEAYLSGVDDLEDGATLVAGRWPRSGAGEAVLFDTTARLLGLEVGRTLRLGPQIGRQAARPVDLTVVGLVRPRPDAGWDRDPLGGEGFDPSPADVRYAPQVNAYGPVLVTLDDLLSGGPSLDRLEVTARPDLSAPTGRDLDRLSRSVLGVDRRLSGTVGDRVQYVRATSPIPDLLLDARRQQQLVAGSVLAFALIGVLLTAIALALAGRLATGVRAEEDALLTALGTGPGQLAVLAAIEAVVLAALAAVISVPASSLLHAALTHASPLTDAGLSTSPLVTFAQVAAVVAGALALAVLHVVLAVRRAPDSGDRRTRRELLARSGADVLLCVLAAVGWWQLRAQSAAADTRADVVRVLAPALVLVACVAVALRLLPPALRRAESLAARARGLVVPLAAFQAARRPQAFAAGLLIGLACAAATFGTAFGATWTASQHDQADLSVGTDLAVALTGPPAAGQTDRVRSATGGVVSPVAIRNVAVGQFLGGPGDAPRLVALDTRRADAVIRGRTGGQWSGLRPTSPATGPQLPEGATLTVTGTATDGPIVVTPHLVLEDSTGLRTACDGPPAPLDGRPHVVPGCAPVAGLRLVAVSLPVTGLPQRGALSAIEATVRLSGGDFPPAWRMGVASPGFGQVSGKSLVPSGPELRLKAIVNFTDPHEASRTLVLTGFPEPGPLPLAISERLARAVKASPGSTLNLSVGTTPVEAVVTRIVARVPSEPGAAAALADVDALSRVLIARGDAEPPVTAWWVGGPRAGAENAIAKLHIGDVTTRVAETERLSSGPLRASLPAVLHVLVAASVLLLLGGVVLHVAYDVQLRALEVARLRGLGVSRRDIRSTLLLEHAAVLLPVLAAGALVGAATTWAVAPLMIRSDAGAAPVPPVAGHWPWLGIGGLLALLVVGSGLAVAAVVTVQARRADAAHLRVAS